MANEWCALCTEEIREAGLNYKQRRPKRTVNIIGGIASCVDHISKAINLHLNRVEAERTVTTREAS